MEEQSKRIRVDVTKENIDWMRKKEESASKIINNALNSAREAEEKENERV